MQVGTGRSILNGIAIGKLKIYKKKDTVISTAEIADTAAEVARFEAAQQKAIEQQTALYEKALAEAGEDIAEVFNIHAMMLEDDDFVDAIKEIINGQHKCAEYAVKTVKGFASTATLEKDGKSCDMRKLMALMGMGVKQGETITIKVEGDDEEAAAAAIQKFLTENV